MPIGVSASSSAAASAPSEVATRIGFGRDRQAGAEVLLLGMRIPPNYGKRYAEMFQRVYGEVAGRQRVALVPFLLEGVGGHDSLMQADGIHPNAEAQPLLLEQVMTSLEPLLQATAAVPAAAARASHV